MNTLKLEILGSGCQKCQQLESNVKSAIASLNIAAEIDHIKDPIDIAKRGVMQTPALVINGQVVSKGKVISADEVKSLLPK